MFRVAVKILNYESWQESKAVDFTGLTSLKLSKQETWNQTQNIVIEEYEILGFMKLIKQK